MALPGFSPGLFGSQLRGAGLGGGAGGGTAGIGTAAATAAGTAAGFPWNIVLPILLSLLQSSGLFGETEGQRREKSLEELMGVVKPEFEYWSGQTRGLNPAIMKALIAQFQRTANWGWPAGKGMDLSFLENLNIPGSIGGKVRV